MPKTKKTTKGGSRPSDYFPDIDQWPNDWMGIEQDLEIGRGLLALFTPFIQHLIDEGLAKKTITSHGCHLGMLGREIIERLNEVDEENRKLSPRELILHYVDQEGGPLLSFWDPNDKTELAHHMAYDATCRKLLKFVIGNNLNSGLASRGDVAHQPSLLFCVGSQLAFSDNVVLQLTAAARNERRAVERKIPLPSQRGAEPDQERNGINGGDPRSGEEAVYAGFDLEQA